MVRSYSLSKYYQFYHSSCVNWYELLNNEIFKIVQQPKRFLIEITYDSVYVEIVIERRRTFLILIFFFFLPNQDVDN
jgi:hypothetical protein